MTSKQRCVRTTAVPRVPHTREHDTSRATSPRVFLDHAAAARLCRVAVASGGSVVAMTPWRDSHAVLFEGDQGSILFMEPANSAVVVDAHQAKCDASYSAGGCMYTLSWTGPRASVQRNKTTGLERAVLVVRHASLVTELDAVLRRHRERPRQHLFCLQSSDVRGHEGPCRGARRQRQVSPRCVGRDAGVSQGQPCRCHDARQRPGG